MTTPQRVPTVTGSPTMPFVGREREMAELAAAMDDAVAGQGRLVLLTGEPGIGKTRTATEAVALARAGQVLWGRCPEAEGTPPYWPWRQTIRRYLDGRPDEVLRDVLGPGAVDVAHVVPEIRERLPDLPDAPASQPEQARFRLFDAVGAFLTRAAARDPLVLVLDDLHWADPGSLLLLQFVARTMAEARLLVIGTYRDVEVGRDHPLRRPLAELAREPVVRRLHLTGLSEAEVARQIELSFGVTASAGVAAAIHRPTEGNPFFVSEIMRLLAAEGWLDRPDHLRPATLPVPKVMRDAIGLRLDRLTPGCRTVLDAAAVVGRDFGLPILRQLDELAQDQLIDVLDEAVAARVIGEIPGTLGRYTFAHALVRETLYEELPPARRMRLHGRIGEALERVHHVSLDEHLAEVAHHFFVASPAGGAERAITYGRRAGEQAHATLAFEDAVAHHERALAVLDLARPGDDRLRCELLLGVGEAQMRTADTDAGRTTLERVAALARRLHASALLGRAALAYGGASEIASTGMEDTAHVALLEEAIAALGDRDPKLRARLLARLATAVYWTAPRERRAALTGEAVDIARRLGDPWTLARVLNARCWSLWGPDDLDDRLATADEIVRVAQRNPDFEMALMGHAWRALAFMEHGEMTRVAGEVEACTRLAERYPVPNYRWWAANVGAMRAILEGRYDDAMPLAAEAAQHGERTGVPDAREGYGLQMAAVLYARGRAADIVPLLEGGVARPDVAAWQSAMAYVYAEAGRDADARRIFEELAANGFAGLPRDATRLIVLVVVAEVCALLGDAARAAVLYDLLIPYDGRLAVAGFGTTTDGAVARYLGVLAAARSRWSEATAHFEAALALHERIGARPFTARTQRDYAHMLVARAAPGDRTRALGLLAAARATAEELGMSGFLEQVVALEARAAALPAGGGGSTPTSVWRRWRDGWAVVHEGTTFHLRDSKGLRYLAHLLAHPGEPFHVRELVATVAGVPVLPLGSGTGAAIDASAKRAYRLRLQDLEDDLDEAERNGDIGRAERAREEIAMIAEQLAGAFGIGGRSRPVGSDAERARLTVRKGIKSALRRLDAIDHDLATVLEGSLRTGYVCVFTPPAGRRIVVEG